MTTCFKSKDLRHKVGAGLRLKEYRRGRTACH